MRILLLHNRYRSEGGEERVVHDLHALLAARGDEVLVLERRSEGVRKVTAARALVGGGASPEEIAQVVRAWRADVVHAHNLHPLFGWRALAAARAAGARTVLHLHNFRLFCAIGVAYRAGAPCFRCRATNTLPGLMFNCRGSVGEAAVYAAGLHRQQPHMFEHADRLVAVSEGTLRRLVSLGMPGDRTSVLANFVRASAFVTVSRAGEGSFALVSGRVVPEKGFDTAVAAAAIAGVPLVVAGDGPDLGRLRALARGADVRFAGWLTPQALADLRGQAAIVLVPSRSDEACPFSALDALAAGVPVLASDRGGLPELVSSDDLLPPGDGERWGRRLAALWGDRQALQRAGDAALQSARARFSEDVYYERLMEIYGG
jgi:glycosyltransferase involved in cell wall biosynthesis